MTSPRIKALEILDVILAKDLMNQKASKNDILEILPERSNF